MKATYIAPDIIVTEYTEGETLLAASGPKVEIDDNPTVPPDYWTMGAKQETTRPGRYRAWNDDDDSLDY